MHVNRTIRAGLLFLSLVLPLAGYASALSHCGPGSSAEHHCQHPSAPAHHPCGGDCCGVAAIAAPPSRWQAPRNPAGEFADFLRFPAPKVAPDRLDRPPRLPV